MALARYESVAVNLAGDVIPNATVEVRRDQPGRPVVPLFSDRDGAVALGNPITADSEGKFGFHVAGGAYYIRVFTGPSQQPLQQYVRRYQAIGTAAERDVEDLASALEAGTATFPTLAELQAFTPAADEGIGGKVTTGADAGFYHYNPALAEGSRWVFDRALYDSVARMTITGGSGNAIEAIIEAEVESANVALLFIEVEVTNSGPVTINDIPVLSFAGEALAAGEWIEGRTYFFSDEGDHFRIRTEQGPAGEGLDFDIQVDELADRDAYDSQAAGYRVLVSDVGDGRAAIYSRVTATPGVWTAPAYLAQGTVRGPSGAVDSRLAAFDGITGQLLKDTGITISDILSVRGYGLAASVGSSALTISLKGADGNDPSASNPVKIAFRNASLPVGTPSLLTATSALSLVISSGSTMGFANATAGRLWIVAFNDAGTLRLGAINCRSGTDIYPLGGTKIASSAAEGGAGGADSAHVFYTGTAVASKAFKVLGYMDWASGLTTAGTWAIVPTTIKLYDLGDKLPGDVVQMVSSTSIANFTMNSATYADTPSEVTMSLTSAANVVSLSATGSIGIVASAADKRVRARLSRGGSQIGTGAIINSTSAATLIVPAAIAAMDAPETTSPSTWKVQINVTDASQTGIWWGTTGDGASGSFICAAELVA